jgi:glycosyltransferase involved in cell wall biosynthesis
VRTDAVGGEVRIDLSAELEGGGTASVLLATIPVEAPEPPVTLERSPAIAVCMATYDPDPVLFERQIRSLLAQTEEDWVCLISDDCSPPAALERIRAVVGGDPRFRLLPSERRLGFYRNFERALRLVPEGIELIALCDQDDHWYPDKLASLRAAIGGGTLAYSDQRRVDRDGNVIGETLWSSRRRNETSLASMLLSNTIVGASALMRRSVLATALPFPEGPGWQFHDHWLSIVALAGGSIEYVDRPLYDYVQHEGAIVGRVGVEPDERQRLPRPRGSARRWADRGRAVYFRAYLPVALQSAVLLERRGSQMSERRRREAARLIAADRSWRALLWLAARSLRELGGRNETLGTEIHLLVGLLWRRLAARAARGRFASRVETEVPGFDLAEFGQRRLRRWLAGG